MIANLLMATALILKGPTSLAFVPEASACRAGESGPSFLVEVIGLKDRKGLIRLEVYPGNDEDFLADDWKLAETGKTFRRIDARIPPSGSVMLCVRTPADGMFAVTVLHDRDANHKFTLSSDGVGFSRNPVLGWSKPKIATVVTAVHDAPVRLRIVMNYRHGLFSFRPEG